MKYTVRHIQRFLENGQIDATLWKSHFPTVLPTRVPRCEDCTEFQSQNCSGGSEPISCFLERGKTEGEEKRRIKKRDPLLGMGSKNLSMSGTALPRDQSKM